LQGRDAKKIVKAKQAPFRAQNNVLPAQSAATLDMSKSKVAWWYEEQEEPLRPCYQELESPKETSRNYLSALIPSPNNSGQEGG